MSSEVVTRSKRKECWDHRDRFYLCLDSNDQDASKCQEYQAKYEAACPKAWRKRFAEVRAYAPVKKAYLSQEKGKAETI